MLNADQRREVCAAASAVLSAFEAREPTLDGNRLTEWTKVKKVELKRDRDGVATVHAVTETHAYLTERL